MKLTATRTWSPTCACCGVKVWPVAPVMSVQVPVDGRDCHWKAKVVGRPFRSAMPATFARIAASSVGVVSSMVGAPVAGTLVRNTGPSANCARSMLWSVSMPSDSFRVGVTTKPVWLTWKLSSPRLVMV